MQNNKEMPASAKPLSRNHLLISLLLPPSHLHCSLHVMNQAATMGPMTMWCTCPHPPLSMMTMTMVPMKQCPQYLCRQIGHVQGFASQIVLIPAHGAPFGSDEWSCDALWARRCLGKSHHEVLHCAPWLYSAPGCNLQDPKAISG